MSLFQTVQEALSKNQTVTVIDTIVRTYLPYKVGYFSQTVDIFVASKKDIFSAEKLQALMLELVPGVEPTQKDDFHEYDGALTFGKLYFDEKIGEATTLTEHTITDPDLIKDGVAGYTNGKYSAFKAEDLNRRTWVRLFPNKRTALKAAESDDCKYCIRISEMGVVEVIKKVLA